MSALPTFFWFDYETFGTHPAWDRPAQFAGLRTTLDLEPVGTPVTLWCRLPGDYLPSPAACRVTGITPDEVNERGSNEASFIAAVKQQIASPGTCSVGYNSIRFDDEFTRFTLFRNFHDAYEQEWKDGNSRWDLLDVVRLTRALRPDGIEWPVHADGSASNRLEDLTRANGLRHDHAHDALSDVYATLGVARLIRSAQPRLFDYVFKHRDKHSAATLLNLKADQPLVLVSGTIPAARQHLAAVLPVARHPTNQNGVVVLDLDKDPQAIAELSADELARRLFRPGKSASGLAADRPGLRTVQVNKCPVLVPLSTIRPRDAERLGIDLDRCRRHHRQYQALANSTPGPAARSGQAPGAAIGKTPGEASREASGPASATALTDRISEAFRHAPDPDAIDVDGSLYSGSFLSAADKSNQRRVRDASPSALRELSGVFEDTRMDELLWRYRARNFPESLDADETLDWQAAVAERLHSNTDPWLGYAQFQQEMAALEWSDEQQALKESLQRYVASLPSAPAED